MTPWIGFDPTQSASAQDMSNRLIQYTYTTKIHLQSCHVPFQTQLFTIRNEATADSCPTSGLFNRNYLRSISHHLWSLYNQQRCSSKIAVGDARHSTI